VGSGRDPENEDLRFVFEQELREFRSKRGRSMSLKELYHRIRPLAKWHAEQQGERLPMDPVVAFVLAAFFSVFGGLFGGFALWINLGFTPENSGGTLILIGGALLMTVLSAVIYAIQKSRAVFYGLNAFTVLTLINLVSSLLK
jgi:hypothetical protein